MLTDEELDAIATAHVRSHGWFIWHRAAMLADPPGIFYAFRRPDLCNETSLYDPFFVSRIDGRLTRVPVMLVLTEIIGQLFGADALQHNSAVSRALMSDDLSDAERQVWAAIIRECMKREDENV